MRQSIMHPAVVVAFSVACLLFAGTSHAAVPAKNADALASGPIIMNELLAVPDNSTSGSAQEFVELLNVGAAPVDLKGWQLSTGNGSSSSWTFPASTLVVPGAYLVVHTSGKAGTPAPAAPPGTVASALKLSSKAKALALYQPDGTLVASTSRLDAWLPGVSIGIPANASTAAAVGPGSYTYLLTPTPGAANSGALLVGPTIHSVKYKGENAGITQSPDQPITVTASVQPRSSSPVQSVVLLYRINYGPNLTMTMQPATVSAAGSGSSGKADYTATIPTSAFKSGDMVRWKVQASDALGRVTLEPVATKPNDPEYRGTVVFQRFISPIPTLFWFSNDEVAAVSIAGAPSCLSYNGTFYDNVHGSRKGMSTLNWAKNKMKFKFGNKKFQILPNFLPVHTLKLQSFYAELGENTYMREVVAYQVMNEAGVMSPVSFHIQVYLNGRFHGIYSMVESVDTTLLQQHGLPNNGQLIKSLSGELSNLRWDLPITEMPSYYATKAKTPQEQDASWQLLAAFTKGLAGGGPVPRSKYLFDALNVPAVINEMATETLLGNMDRCTKNFYIYQHPQTQEWFRVPWDIETSMGQDNGLGGAPGPYYCVLACEQWNSPLYCDSEHPQDLEVNTAWGQTTAVNLNSWVTRAPAASGRRRQLLQSPIPAEGNPASYKFPKPDDWSNPDRDATKTVSVSGAPGTYNHLVDAVLDVNATRAMYLRRLRTLADVYYGQGRLRKIIDDTYMRIKPIADADNALWQRGDPARGYQQLTNEFIPIRTKQLLSLYAPGGADPLLPAAQGTGNGTAVPKVVLDAVVADGALQLQQRYLRVASQAGSDVAVDVSGWRLVGRGIGSSGDYMFVFPPGTVLAPGGAAYITPSATGFRGRPASPKGGEGLLVLQDTGVGQVLQSQQQREWVFTTDTGTEVDKRSL